MGARMTAGALRDAWDDHAASIEDAVKLQATLDRIEALLKRIAEAVEHE